MAKYGCQIKGTSPVIKRSFGGVAAITDAIGTAVPASTLKTGIKTSASSQAEKKETEKKEQTQQLKTGGMPNPKNIPENLGTYYGVDFDTMDNKPFAYVQRDTGKSLIRGAAKSKDDFNIGYGTKNFKIERSKNKSIGKGVRAGVRKGDFEVEAGKNDFDKYFKITFSKKFKKGGMPSRKKSAGHYRSTESGAGMTAKGVAAYRRKNPGSKLKTAVTGKVKPGSKAAKRRKSYCARSLGQLKRASAKTRNDPNSRIRQARRRWKC